MPTRALSPVAVTALATVVVTLSPVQKLGAARFRGFAQSAATAAAAPTELQVGQTYVRELSGGGSRLYQLRLDEGEYAGLTVEQRGIDVAVQLLGPDGSTTADVQDELRIGHAEPVEIVAEKAATYTLGGGVNGLRRAFFLAGAETLVMSLWPVSDVVTREMMTAYYGGLKAGEGRGNALRQVQLAMLARKNRRHPFYWASFIQAGEWTSLDGRR